EKKIGQVEDDRPILEAGKGARDEADAEGPAGQRFGVERHELDGDGNAESSDGEIVRPEPKRDGANDGGSNAREQSRRDPAEPDRQAEAAEPPRGIGCG